MVISQIFITQSSTHVYRMLKRISGNERTLVNFKSHFKEAYLDQEELEQTVGVSRYGSANDVKHGEMEDASINVFVSNGSNRSATC